MRRAWLAVQALLAAAVLFFVARSVARNWGAIRGSGVAISLDPLALLAAAGIILATYALLISAWRAVLLGWGQRLPYPQAARIWTLSNLARYVPGRVWQIAGMAAMAQRAGVSPWAATGSAVVVQLLAVATGALVTGMFVVDTAHPWLIAGCGVAAFAAAAVLASARATGLLGALLHRVTGRQWRIEPVARGPLVTSAAVTALSWIAYGLALYFLVQGLLGEPRLSVGASVGAFTASYLVGLLLVFTPGGLGAREGAIYVLLTGPLGPAAALVVMIGSRLLMTATEVVAALITLPLAMPRPDANQA
jgi:uncharacterized membrane protein YbhN (UPF0104 family)